MDVDSKHGDSVPATAVSGATPGNPKAIDVSTLADVISVGRPARSALKPLSGGRGTSLGTAFQATSKYPDAPTGVTASKAASGPPSQAPPSQQASGPSKEQSAGTSKLQRAISGISSKVTRTSTSLKPPQRLEQLTEASSPALSASTSSGATKKKKEKRKCRFIDDEAADDGLDDTAENTTASGDDSDGASDGGYDGSDDADSSAALDAWEDGVDSKFADMGAKLDMLGKGVTMILSLLSTRIGKLQPSQQPSPPMSACPTGETTPARPTPPLSKT